MPKTPLLKVEFNTLPNWESEEFEKALASFVHSCKSSKTRALYANLCKEAVGVKNPKLFLQENFTPYKIESKENDGLLTGYYEPQLRGSKTKSEVYLHPVYEVPDDLITVDLSSVYPELKNYRLRGRVEGSKLIPYYTRAQSDTKEIDANIICYVDSKIEKFFLEIQGSGRVTLDTNETLYIGYANQNGHKYRAIGAYMVSIGALTKGEVSLQTIKKWLEENPHRIDEVLRYNDSLIYFEQRDKPASGSLGLELLAKRSVAVDNRYIPLGAMLYLSAPIKDKNFATIVLAQDTGGAIKGAVRADLFMGYGAEAMEIAGELKSPLELWILLPKKMKG
ncbi:MAG: MltA domain-containing protein [Sulfurimonadaceae bacterium]|nr:MltA domain-containing protein [Sulfurimonadaceae bacterium]